MGHSIYPLSSLDEGLSLPDGFQLSQCQLPDPKFAQWEHLPKCWQSSPFGSLADDFQRGYDDQFQTQWLGHGNGRLQYFYHYLSGYHENDYGLKLWKRHG